MEKKILESFFSRGEEFRILFSQLSQREMTHAFLIAGEKGTGKKTLARLMAQTMLCSDENPMNRPCGKCKNCILAEKNELTDLIIIERNNSLTASAKKERASIPVDDIREMIRLCGIKSAAGNMHVAIISEADKMTVQSQNCLLKTLEEPNPDTCIILVTDHPESLLTTVISRCRTIRLHGLDDDYILQALKSSGVQENKALEAVAIADGSIGRALELASDDSYWQLRDEVMNIFFRTTVRSEVVRISTQWKDRKQDSEYLLGILESCLRTLAEARFGGKKTKQFDSFPDHWKRFTENAEPEGFLRLTESVVEAKRELQFSVNFQAVLERIIFSFMGEGNAWLQ